LVTCTPIPMVNAPEKLIPWIVLAVGKARYFYFKKPIVMLKQSKMEILKLNQSNFEDLNLIQLIESCLYHGDQSEVAKELGISLTSVNRVLKGKKKSKRIITALYNKAVDNCIFEKETHDNLLNVIQSKTKSEGGLK